MQSFLDGQAPEREAARVREHTRSCARCRSELEAWSLLFSELGELEEVRPGADFQGRILAELPSFAPRRLGLAARLGGWLGLTPAGAAALPRHVPSERLQEFLEGLLPRGEALAVEGHLHACRNCREEVAGWRSFLEGLNQLPSLTPSTDFSERVMAHVRVQLAAVSARPTVKERLQLLGRSVSPETRKRVAALAGAALTPAVTLALVAYTVFSHPLVTVGNLASFLWLEGSDLLGRWGGGLMERLTGSATAFRAWSTLDALAGSPAAAALAVTGLCALTLLAVWVLYRNVIAVQPVESRYAR